MFLTLIGMFLAFSIKNDVTTLLFPNFVVFIITMVIYLFHKSFFFSLLLQNSLNSNGVYILVNFTCGAFWDRLIILGGTE